MPNSAPLKLLRLITLSLAWVWAWIALAVEIDAFVKSNRDKKAITSQVPPPTTIALDTNDVFQSGSVATAISAAIVALCTLFIAFLLVSNRLSTRTLPAQYLSLGFLALWLFATQIPVSHFVATRSVKVSAFIAGIPVQSGLVSIIVRTLGAKTKYSSYDYLKLVAILPWFTFLFTLIAAIVAFVASRRPVSSSDSKVEPTTEKPAETT